MSILCVTDFRVSNVLPVVKSINKKIILKSGSTLAFSDGWMDDLQLYVLFNSISVIS